MSDHMATLIPFLEKPETSVHEKAIFWHILQITEDAIKEFIPKPLCKEISIPEVLIS